MLSPPDTFVNQLRKLAYMERKLSSKWIKLDLTDLIMIDSD